MTINHNPYVGLWRTLIVVSGLCITQPALAQDKSPAWGSLTVQSKASSSERVSYFQQNLRPHAASAYENPEYHKTIVKLNWFDDGKRQSRVVNLKRTFDIYGLFEGTSLDLTEQAKAILNDLGTAITSQGIDARMYAVAGHTVAAGDKKSDQDLATQRAKVVRTYLMKTFNIAENRLVPVGFGSHNLKHKKTPGKIENNRIEICMIEDLYERKPTTTVQLPDANADKPLEIKVVSLDTTSAPKTGPEVEGEIESVDDDVDAELELSSQSDVQFVSKPRIRKRFAKRTWHRQQRRMVRRYKRNKHMSGIGWNTKTAQYRGTRSSYRRYNRRSRRIVANPYCAPW